MKLEGSVILVLFAVAYATLARPLYAFGIASPDFVFLALVYLAFFAPTHSLLALTAAVSFVLDILSLDPAGTHAVALLPPMWLVGRLRGWFVLDSAALRWIVVLPVCLLSMELRQQYLAFLRPGTPVDRVADLACALYTAALGLVVHTLLDRRFRPALGWTRNRSLSGWS